MKPDQKYCGSSTSESDYSEIQEEIEWQWPIYNFSVESDDEQNTQF